MALPWMTRRPLPAGASVRANAAHPRLPATAAASSSSHACSSSSSSSSILVSSNVHNGYELLHPSSPSLNARRPSTLLYRIYRSPLSLSPDITFFPSLCENLSVCNHHLQRGYREEGKDETVSGGIDPPVTQTRARVLFAGRAWKIDACAHTPE